MVKIEEIGDVVEENEEEIPEHSFASSALASPTVASGEETVKQAHHTRGGGDNGRESLSKGEEAAKGYERMEKEEDKEGEEEEGLGKNEASSTGEGDSMKGKDRGRLFELMYLLVNLNSSDKEQCAERAKREKEQGKGNGNDKEKGDEGKGIDVGESEALFSGEEESTVIGSMRRAIRQVEEQIKQYEGSSRTLMEDFRPFFSFSEGREGWNGAVSVTEQAPAEILETYSLLGLTCVESLRRNLHYSSEDRKKEGTEELEGEEEEEEEEVLGVRDIKIFKVLLQFICITGIYPHLEAGYGIPFERRCESHSQLRSLAMDGQSKEGEMHAKMLFSVIGRLYLCCTDPSGADCEKKRGVFGGILQPYIVNTCLVDMLAGVLQLCSSSVNETASSRPYRTYAMKVWQDILAQVHPSVLLESLSLLMSTNPKMPPLAQHMCAAWMSEVLVQKGGVYAMMMQMLCSNNQDSHQNNWRAFERAAYLLSTCPKHINKERYFKSVCSQMHDLLHLKALSKKNRTLYSDIVRIVIMGVDKLLDKSPDVVKEYFLDPILRPFYAFWEDPEDLARTKNLQTSGDGASFAEQGELEVVNESVMTRCVEDVHKIFVVGESGQRLVKMLSHAIQPFFRLYCFTKRSISNVKNATEEILTTYFRLVEKREAVETLLGFVGLGDTAVANDNDGKLMLVFASGGSGGVVLKIVERSIHSEIGKRNYVSEAEGLVDILDKLKRKGLAGDFFVAILKQFTDIQSSSKLTDTYESERKHALLLNVILLMSDQLGAAVLENSSQTVTFISTLLMSNDEETLSLSLGLLSVVISGQAVKLDSKTEECLHSFRERLEQLSNHELVEIKEMATDIVVSIKARETLVAHDGPSEQGTVKKEDDGNEIMSKLEIVLSDLKDPIMPVRAHALMTLRQMVLGKHPIITRKINGILDIFVAQVSNTDSYMYLTAINGMVAVGDCFPEKTLPRLKRLFLSKLDIDVRLRVGEAMLKIALRLNETLPKYFQYFIDTFLNGARAESLEMRASSLSNLATSCELMKFSLHSCIDEILSCIELVLKSDPEKMVRRAATSVLCSILKGLGKEGCVRLLLGDSDHTRRKSIVFKPSTFSSTSRLKSIYKLLKQQETAETDGVGKINCRAAIYEIDEVIKSILVPER
eukprot:Nk52_evm11s279 gene=Nk52_evmTU11s279